MNNSIRVWVHNQNRTNLLGVIIAAPLEDGHIGIGWSKCNKKDVFSKEKAVLIAESRIQHGSNAALPYFYEDLVLRFAERAQRYYKDKSVLICNQY